MKRDARDLARPIVRSLVAYDEEAAKGGLNLMNNANLWGANPALAKALARARPDAYWDYPENTSRALCEALARKHGLAPDQFLVGNGSNELIDVLLRTFLDPGEVALMHAPIFGMIPHYARLAGARVETVPLKRDFALDVSALAESARTAKVTFLCRPNNPTGNAFPRREVETVMAAAGGLVVIDEAYAEFASSHFLDDAASRPNLVILRTFSKAYGLAGLRVGYAVGAPAAIHEMVKVRGPFRLNQFSELAATMALDEPAWLASVVDGVRTERARLSRALAGLGFEVYPSEANFILVRPPVAAPALSAALRQRNVWVRDYQGSLAAFLRITVGPPTATERFLAALAEVLPKLEGAE